MTIASTRTRELNINQLILHAARTATLLSYYQGTSGQEALLSFGRDCLDLILDTMEAEGLRARAITFDTVTMVAGQSAYTLDDDTIDVVGHGMYIPPDATAAEIALNQAGGEIPVVTLTRDQWQNNPAKDSTGRPLNMFCDRTTSPPVLRVWPTPTSSDLGTIRLQIHRLAADSSDGSKTVDMERFWGLYIIYALARELAVANALNANRVGYYAQTADMWLQKCKSYSAQKTATRMTLRHKTGWN